MSGVGRLARVAGLLTLVLLAFPGAAASELPESPWILVGAPKRAAFADVLPLYLPAIDGPELAAALRLAREGQLLQALRALPRVDEPAPQLLRALLMARSRPAAEHRKLRGALLRAARDVADPAAKTCAQLERARLALLSGREEEAFGDLALARRSLPEADAELRQRIDHYHAEALWLAGRDAAALVAARKLFDSSLPRVAWVASFRVALADPDRAWPDLRSELDRGRLAGVDVDVWSAEVGERAFQSGHLEEALAWLSRAEELLPAADLVTLRKADLLVAMGKVDVARRIFSRIERKSSLRAAREVAALRLASQKLGEPARAVERLELAARSALPRVAAQALEVLSDLHIENDRPEAALDAVGRWRSLAPRGGTPGLAAATDAAVLAAVRSSEDCITLVRRLAGGRDVWLPSAQSPDPMLRLGACASELGLSSTAADVYRALGRRFPEHFGPALTLRIARASWDLGDRAVVDSLLAAQERSAKHERMTFDQKAPWLLLRAEISLADGGYEEARRGLVQIVGAAETPPRERELALAALIEMPRDVEASAALVPALRAGLAHPSDLPPELQGRSWLRLGDLLEEQGQTEEARRAYQRASEFLASGVSRGRVLHALARTAGTRAEREALLVELAAGTASGVWARLAQGELRLGHLRRVRQK